MKFLDRFKRKPPTEPPLPMPKKATETKKADAPPAAYKPEIKGAEKHSTPPAPTPPLQMPGVKKPVGENELRLELGDFLHRIPAHLLLPGPHDLKSELRFDIGDLSDRISKGLTTVSLAEIYKRVPTIFRGEILESDNIEVRFPWQKLAKLVNTTKPGSGPETAPFPALAERLRAKKPARAIKTGDPAEPQPSGPIPVVAGRTAAGKQSSWFTKTESEQPTAAPNSDAPKSADMSAVLPPPLSVKPSEPTPLAPPAITIQTPEAPKMTADDLRFNDLPPESQRRFVTMKGEYERQISEIQSQRRSIAEARDRANAEVERLKKEHEHNLYLLAKEQTASSMSHELIQRHQKERDELNAQIQILRAQLDGNGALPATNAANDEQVAALVQERDALLEQKAYLSAQLAEMTNRRSGPAKSGGTTPQSQRQVDEFQRRIALLESAQKEAALELQRERESKGKIEKLLATADRLQQESALHMEETKLEMKKEIELSFRKNIKELEEQLAAAKSSVGDQKPAPTPSDESPAWQAEAISQLEADIENYRDRIKVLIRERDEARNSKPPAAPAELSPELDALRDTLANAKAENDSLRAEIDELRKVTGESAHLQAELEESRGRILQLQDVVSSASEKLLHASEAESALATLRAQFGDSSTRIAELEDSLASRDAASSSTASEKDARIAELTSLIEKLTAGAQETAALQQEIANLRADQAQAETFISETRDQLSALKQKLQEQSSAHQSELEAVTSSKDTQIAQLASELEQLKAQIPANRNADEELSKLRADFEETINRQNEERSQFEFDRKTLLEDRQKIAGQLQDEIHHLQQQLQSISSEREKLKTENADLIAELKAEAEAHEELLTTIDKDHTSVVQAKEQLERQLAEAEQTRQELEALRAQPPDANLQAEIARLRAELDELRRNLTDAQHALELRTNALHQNETSLSRLTAEHQSLSASLQEFEHLKQTSETAATQRIQELEADRHRLAARLNDAESALMQVSTERERIASSLSEAQQLSSEQSSTLLREKEQLTTHLTQLASERDMLAMELSASRKQHQQLIASLDNERGELVVAHEALQKRLTDSEREKAELNLELNRIANDLEAERQKAVNFQTDLNNQFHSQASEIENRHSSEMSALRSALESARQLMADLRNASAQESESLLSKNAALEARLTDIERSHSAELDAAIKEVEERYEAERASLDERLSATENERVSLQTSLKEVADYERTIATLRADKENAVAALAAAERIHVNALAEAEQRYRDGLTGPARELEQIRVTAETLKAELIVARKMHGEVMGSLDKEREQFSTAKADWEKKLGAVDEARRQTNSRLDDREQAIRLLEEKLNQASAASETQRNDLSELRNNLDAARRENESLGNRAAAVERQLRDEIASLTQKVESLVTDKQSLNSRIAELESASRDQIARLESTSSQRISELETSSREQIEQLEKTHREQIAALESENDAKFREMESAHAQQFEQLTSAQREQLAQASLEIRNSNQSRDQAVAELAEEKARRDAEIANALREREDALRAAGTELAKLEQELSRAREQRDIFKREKDELARRISQVTEQQKRMLDDISAGLGHSAPPTPRPPQTSVFEVTPDDGNINLPRIRPVQVRPPQVKVL
jgi:chromosome segregation ATPase